MVFFLRKHSPVFFPFLLLSASSLLVVCIQRQWLLDSRKFRAFIIIVNGAHIANNHSFRLFNVSIHVTAINC